MISRLGLRRPGSGRAIAEKTPVHLGANRARLEASGLTKLSRETTSIRGRIGCQLADLARRMWFPPEELGTELGLEWRLVAVRWIGIVVVIPTLFLAHMEASRQLFALGVLVLATVYNALAGKALRSNPGILRNGYLTSICDALLNVALIVAVGGFDSPFYYLLFTVTISAAMRYGYGQGAAMVGMYAGMDALLGLHGGRVDWTPYICRSGFLAITAMLAGYLREQARLAHEALGERLRQARLLDAACHLLGTGLDVGQMHITVARAACHLLGGHAAVLIPHFAADAAAPSSWTADGTDPDLLDALSQIASTGPAFPAAHILPNGQHVMVLAVALPERRPDLAHVAVALPPGAVVPGPEILDRFAERAALALENAGLYHELALRHAQLQEQADSDPLTGLLNHRAMLSQLDEALNSQMQGVLLMLDVDNFKLFNDTFGHLTGDAVLRQTAALLRLTCPERALIGRYGGDEFLIFDPLLDRAQAGLLAVKLVEAMRQVAFATPDGETIPISLSIGIASAPADGHTRRSLLVAADEAMYQDKRGGHAYPAFELAVLREEPAFGVLESLILAVDRKDRYTWEHSLDVTRLALLLANFLELSSEDQRALALAGPLHDVGKIAVPDAMLRKPGRLTSAEYATVQSHVAYGVAFIRGLLPHEGAMIDAVQHHHERWDGRGYPQGITGPQTPLLGRIMQVADAVSAMMLDRPYRCGLPWVTVAAELRAGAGRQFDPALVEPFIAAVEAQHEGEPSDRRSLSGSLHEVTSSRSR